MEQPQWIFCPACKNKTRLKIKEDTVLENLFVAEQNEEYIETGIIPKFSLCSDGVAWFQQHGQWQDGSYTPKAGDIIFFDWESDGNSDHVGIVEKIEDGIVYTIEGNSDDACKQRNYPIGSSVVCGYGIPMY